MHLATESLRSRTKCVGGRVWTAKNSIPAAACFDVFYKGTKVGLFVPDLIAFESVVVDTKVIDQITDRERGLMLNYLRITNLRVGVILNFKYRKLEWERIVL